MRRIRPTDGLSNRDVAKTSKGAHHHWCMTCDACGIGQYDRCPVCGRKGRDGKKHRPTTIPAKDCP